MQPKFWSDKCLVDVPDGLDFAAYCSVVEIFECPCEKFTDHSTFSDLGVTLSYAELDRLFVAFAIYLQKQTDPQPGGHITVQIPNVLQYSTAVFDALRVGLAAVNTNPLYTAHKVRHQFKDADVRALVYLNVFGKLVEEVLPDTRVECLIETRMGDLLSALKGRLVNSVVKLVKKTVPDYRLPQALLSKQALKQGQDYALQPVRAGLGGVAASQYIGGTTGVSKGVMLTHGNLVADILQVHVQFSQLGKDGLPLMRKAQEMMIAPLPLYHIYAFTANCTYMTVSGNHNTLITNPHNTPGFIKELKKWRFSALLSLNTLFITLMEYPEFEGVDLSNLEFTDSGGTALASAATERQKGVTDCTVVEGYGLTECPSVATANPYGEQAHLGTAGVPVVDTALKVIGEQSNELSVGERGEPYVKGSQVMKGYWQRPEAVEETLNAEGWLKTGGIAVADEDGFVCIVDRRKDLILVSGFNVYPNEVEDAVMAHPKVASCAAAGIPDEKPGEAVKLFMMTHDPSLSVEELKTYCKEDLTGYKIPRQIVLRDVLPMTPVGKTLRRELREVT